MLSLGETAGSGDVLLAALKVLRAGLAFREKRVGVGLKVKTGGNYLSKHRARMGTTCLFGDLLRLAELKTSHCTAELRCTSTWRACTQTGCWLNMLMLMLMLNGVRCLFSRSIWLATTADGRSGPGLAFPSSRYYSC
jgi:hypothetical protein